MTFGLISHSILKGIYGISLVKALICKFIEPLLLKVILISLVFVVLRFFFLRRLTDESASSLRCLTQIRIFSSRFNFRCRLLFVCVSIATYRRFSFTLIHIYVTITILLLLCILADNFINSTSNTFLLRVSDFHLITVTIFFNIHSCGDFLVYSRFLFHRFTQVLIIGLFLLDTLIFLRLFIQNLRHFLELGYSQGFVRIVFSVSLLLFLVAGGCICPLILIYKEVLTLSMLHWYISFFDLCLSRQVRNFAFLAFITNT